MGEYFCNGCVQNIAQTDLVCPQRERLLLGQMLSKKLSLGYSKSLKHIRNTKLQMGLLRRESRENTKGAFVLAENSKLKNENFILGDVWIIGSFLKGCAYILKRAGAKSVWGVTLTR